MRRLMAPVLASVLRRAAVLLDSVKIVVCHCEYVLMFELLGVAVK